MQLALSRIFSLLKKDYTLAINRTYYTHEYVVSGRRITTMFSHTERTPPVYVASYYLHDLAEAVQKVLPEAEVIKIIPKPIGCNGILDLKTNIKHALPRVLGNGVLDDKDVNTLVEKAEIVFCDTHLLKNCINDLKKIRWIQSKGAVARRCKQLGMTVHGVTRSTPSEDSRSVHVDVYRPYDELQQALCECDYICCAVPSTPETKGLLSGNVLSGCKNRKPVLISVGRGDIIDEQSIISAVQEGWLGGAVLDVLPEEPLPESSPLWSLPNVFISPHIAGYTRNEQYRQQYASAFAENYRRYCRGEPLKDVIDFDKGY